MNVTQLHGYGAGHHRELRGREIDHEAKRQLLRREIENDNDPDFVPDHCWDAEDDRKHGLRRSPSLGHRLKVFGRVAEILASPLARIEGSRWRDMPSITSVAPHPRRCLCCRCVKLQQTTYSGDGDPDFAVPTYIETPAGYRTVPHELSGRSAVLVIDGTRYVLLKRSEVDRSSGNAYTYDAWTRESEAAQ